jgi:hypothetical protein
MSTMPLAQDRTSAGQSSLAAAMIGGALLQIVAGFATAEYQALSPTLWWIASINAVSHLLLLAGVLGLARSGVAGRGRLATAGWGLTALGLIVLTIAEAISTTNMDVAVVFFTTATLVLMVGLILFGIAVLRAGHWSGWQRFTVLTCGLFIPVILLPALAMPGYAPHYAIGLWGVCWLLIGLAQWVEAHGSANQPAQKGV